MDLDQILQNIEANKNNELEKSKEFYKNRPEPVAETVGPEPVDMYKQTQERIREVEKKPSPKGASPDVNMGVYAVIDGMGIEGLPKLFKRAKKDIEVLKERGEKNKVELRRQQYMQENFLPAVEAVVNATSPDEVLNSKQALRTLDKYALLEGSGSGYTASYIRQAYGNQLGQVEGRSDASVRSNIRRLNALLDQGQIRTAYGLANRLKKQIDDGQAMADGIDYDLVSRVVAYYN